MPEPILTPMRSAFSAVTVEAGIPERLDARRHAVMDEDIHAAGFLGRQVGRNVETLDLAGNARLEGGSVETGDRTNAALAGEMLFQVSATVLPTGETSPKPVTTTLRRDKAASCG